MIYHQLGKKTYFISTFRDAYIMYHEIVPSIWPLIFEEPSYHVVTFEGDLQMPIYLSSFFGEVVSFSGRFLILWPTGLRHRDSAMSVKQVALIKAQNLIELVEVSQMVQYLQH